MNKREYNSFELQARVKNKKVQKSQYLPTRQCLDNISFHSLYGTRTSRHSFNVSLSSGSTVPYNSQYISGSMGWEEREE